MTCAFRCTALVKSYRRFRLGPLDLSLDPGTVLGYVGLNGSGKTTTMNCLSGLVKADSGQVEIYGRANHPADPAWKADLAFVTDTPLFYERWTAARNLAVLRSFYARWSDATAEELVRRFELPLDTRVKNLSRGNRTKLALVGAVAAGAPLLLLDEPTSGLDPVVREEVLSVLFEMLEDGSRAFLYSTHILTDIARLADELAFLAEGQVVLRATVADLVEQWSSVSCRCGRDLPELAGAVRVEREGERHHVISRDHAATTRHLRELGAAQIELARMGVDQIAVEVLKGGHRVAAG